MDDALRVQIREAQHNLPQNIEGVPPLLLRLVAKHLCKRGIAVKGKQGAGSKQSTSMDKYSKIITISTVPIIIRTHCHIAVGSVMQPVPPLMHLRKSPLSQSSCKRARGMQSSARHNRKNATLHPTRTAFIICNHQTFGTANALQT